MAIFFVYDVVIMVFSVPIVLECQEALPQGSFIRLQMRRLQMIFLMAFVCCIKYVR